MKKRFKRLTLDELAASGQIQIIDEIEQSTFIGGCKSCEEANSYGYSVYTKQEFEDLLNQENWNGGFVCGMGYILPEVTVDGGYNSTDYGGYQPSYMFEEGIGAAAGFYINGTVLEREGNLIVSATGVVPAALSGDVTMNGYAELMVNGVVTSTQYFSLGESYFSQTGTEPIGTVSFDIPSSGTVEIRVSAGYTYSSGGNNNAPLFRYDQIVYKKNY